LAQRLGKRQNKANRKGEPPSHERSGLQRIIFQKISLSGNEEKDQYMKVVFDVLMVVQKKKNVNKDICDDQCFGYDT